MTRAVSLLLAALLIGIGAAVLLRDGAVESVVSGAGDAVGRVGDVVGVGGGSSRPEADQARQPPAAAGPFAYRAGERKDFEARAAAGLAHPLYAFSPGGAVATAQRVAALRPEVERAAARGGVDPDVLEGIVFLESAGRPDAMASDDVRGAVGLTQILAETGTSLLGLRIDVAASRRLTRRIRRGGPRTAARERARRRIDERYDPAKALAATVRYLVFAKGKLGRDDLVTVSYHMGVGNLQDALKLYGKQDIPYAQLFFDSSPQRHADAYAKLASLGDDSSTYLWRVRAAQQIMAAYRKDPAKLQAVADLQTGRNSAELVLHPPGTSRSFAAPGDIAKAVGDGGLLPLTNAILAPHGLRISPAMGELADALHQRRTRYRALAPQALATLAFIGDQVKAIAGSTRPLIVTSSVRDQHYQRLLIEGNDEATRNFSEHTTGFTFDIARRYASRRQALAFQFMIDRLTALDRVAWVREPAAIHVTVASG